MGSPWAAFWGAAKGRQPPRVWAVWGFRRVPRTIYSNFASAVCAGVADAYIGAMRYLAFAALVLVPVVFWPTPWTLIAVLALGLPVAVAMLGEEKPNELNPAIWDKDPAVRKARLAAAMDQWQARRDRGGL